jgi:hypothetical protein
MNDLETFIIYYELNYEHPFYSVKDYFEKFDKSSFGFLLFYDYSPINKFTKYERIVGIKNQRLY